jgi:glycerophosphoryl diester phosphodiesterase
MLRVLRGDGPVLRIGHRGAPALAPENTLTGFEAAVAAGVDLIELDALALRDGSLVVAHSDRLAEVTHGAVHGRVGDRTLRELRQLAPARPTLEDAFAFFAERAPGTGLLLDLKSPGHEPEIVEALRHYGLVARTLVDSTEVAPLRRLRALEPGLRLGLGYPRDRYSLSSLRPLAPAALATALALRIALPARIGRLLAHAGADLAALHFLVVSRAAVERAHAAGAAVFVWTVNDARTLRRVVAAGVDGVVTDDPRLLAANLTA